MASQIGVRFNPATKYFIWISSELAIIAADIQELLGTSIALKLLTGIDGTSNLIISVLLVLCVLYIQEVGQQVLELAFLVFVGGMAVCFFANFVAMKPDLWEILNGFVPNLPDTLGFTGVIGSIIMPQNLFLQSSLVMTRADHKLPPRRLSKIIKIETVIIIIVSFVINLSVVGVFGNPAFKEKDITLENAGEHLVFLLPEWSALLWAIGLFCSGLSSTTTGALTGQYMMEGIVNLKINRFLRLLVMRLLTLLPCILIMLFYKADDMIGLLNIIQFLQLPFCVIPLVRLVMDPSVMGVHTYGKKRILFIGVMSAGLQIINIYAIYGAVKANSLWKILLFLSIVILQGIMILYLIFTKLEKAKIQNPSPNDTLEPLTHI